jgi:hypothetical protein
MGCNVIVPVYFPLSVMVPPPLQSMLIDPMLTDCDELVLDEVVVGLLWGGGAAEALGVHISAAIISTMLASSVMLHALHRKRVSRRSACGRSGVCPVLFRCPGP